MVNPKRNEELKDLFEQQTGRTSARANGTILGYATGYYVVSAILRYLEFHPEKKGQPIKLKKLAKYATPRPLIVRESDGIRFYRLLKLSEDSGIIRIESRRKFTNGSVGVTVKINSKAKLSDYEVKWPKLPENTTYHLKEIFEEYSHAVDDKEAYNQAIEELFGKTKNTFWRDGWTEYDAKFIYKGVYAMLLDAASDRKDKERLKEVEANYNNLYQMLYMIEEECEILLYRIKYLESHNYGPVFY